MSDREMLEDAAKAVGIDAHWGDGWQSHMMFRALPRPNSPLVTNVEWNPLADDGDALRLAAALGLVVDCSRPSAGEPYKQHAIWLDDAMSNAELTRRAIVRAAAEIGRGIARQTARADLPEDNYYKAMAEAEIEGRME